MRRFLSAAAIATLVAVGCSSNPEAPPSQAPLFDQPADFPPMPVPADNQLTADRIALGRRLFFDKELSRTREVSCGSCHLQENAFADPNRVSVGIEGRTGTRNAPALINLAWNTSFFWDGGVPTLEQQAIAPIINPLEMDMTFGELTGRLKGDPSYLELFRRAYGAEPAPEWVTKAIASFVRTMVSSNSRYDRHRRGETQALDASEKRGMELFFGERAECFHCHVGFNLTNNAIRGNGLYAVYADSGRARITERESDLGRFKVPTLRNIALTAPYMHDGSLATLEEVVEHYNSGGKGHPNQDPTLHPLGLTDQEKRDLVAFMQALTDSGFVADPRFRE